MTENNFTEPLESQQREHLIESLVGKIQNLSDAELLHLHESLTSASIEQQQTGTLPKAVRDLEIEATEGEKISDGVIFAEFASFQEGEAKKASGELSYSDKRYMFPVHLLESTGDGQNGAFSQAFPELRNRKDKIGTLYCVSYLDSQGRVAIVGAGQIAPERRRSEYERMGRINTHGFKILFGKENSQQAELFISQVQQNPKTEIETLLNEVLNNTAYPTTSPEGKIDNSRSASTSLINDDIVLNFVDLREK